MGNPRKLRQRHVDVESVALGTNGVRIVTDGVQPAAAYVTVYSGKLYAWCGLSHAAQVNGVDGINVFAKLLESFDAIEPIATSLYA